MEEVRRIRPRRMIDVGCGLGVYGVLCRVQLDLYDDEAFDKKLFRNGERYKRWDTVIDAIEGFEDYLEFIPRWAYDDIMIEDVRTALPKLPDANYDMALALAIIEHLSKEDGAEFVRQLQRISRTVIISVPKNVMPQEVAGNDFETHRSQWSQEDFLALGFNQFIPHWGVWIAIYDPALPPYQREEGVASSESGQAAVPPGGDDALAEVVSRLDEIREMQRMTLDRLSVSVRVRSLLHRLGLRR